jgi:hypothetical protein
MENLYLLILGDSFTLGVITLIGFASHGEFSIYKPATYVDNISAITGRLVCGSSLAGTFQTTKTKLLFSLACTIDNVTLRATYFGSTGCDPK